MKIEALNKDGNIFVVINDDHFIDLDATSDSELLEILKENYKLCEEAATHLACAIFSLSYVVE